MMIRSLLFTLLGALCSVSGLFEESRQTAMICVLAYTILLVRQANAFRWTAATPGKVSAIFERLEASWGPAISKYVNWLRPKVHLPSHWGQLYLIMGAPGHHSTMHHVEAMQRILKNAWRFTSRRVDAGRQVLQRIGVLRWIHSRLRPSMGNDVDTIGALCDDRVTQAYLTGSLKSQPGVNAAFTEPDEPDQRAWNASLRVALRDLAHPAVPPGHVWHPGRAYPRRGGTFVRTGVTAVSVATLPAGCCENATGSPNSAIFSLFEEDEGAASPVGADMAPVRESETERFIVDFWISYDVTGLSAENPNNPPARQLSEKELNADHDDVKVIDIAVGRMLVEQPSITMTGNAVREEAASYVFQRMKPTAKLAILEVSQLCRPLWAIPFLGDVEAARTFFDENESKWCAKQWLVVKKLY